MRRIGRLASDAASKLFGDVLYARGIENEVEKDADGQSSVWVLDDARIEEASALFVRYQAEPGHADFQGASAAASVRRRAEEAEAHKFQREAARQERVVALTGRPLATMVLVGASVVVTLMTGFGGNALANWFLISNFLASSWWDGLMEIRHGQVWRLVTPIFLHLDILHLIFNVWWVKDLGAAVELAYGRRHMIWLCLVLAVASNLIQYIFSGPGFGGMSGVVYGLFGFIWMRSRTDPSAPIQLPPFTIVFMLAWFFLCFFNVIPSIANGTHVGGLMFGTGWGYLSGTMSRARR